MVQESDPFVKDGGDARLYGGEPGPMRKGKSLRSSAAAGLAVLITLPWLKFCLVTCLFTFIYQEYAPIVWALVMSCLGLAVLLAGLYFFSRRIAHLALGVLCLFGCFFGLLVGVFIDSAYMQEHSRLENGAKYHNVQPGEAATAHADAASLSFSVGSGIDTLHAAGFKKTDDTYCAAPILDGTEVDNTVQYWAVGVNCCLERGDFECDDANRPDARGGVVLPKDDENMGHYKQAVRLVEDAHGLAAAKEALFLRWVIDPSKIKDELWSFGVNTVLLTAFAHLLFSIVVALILNHFVTLR